MSQEQKISTNEQLLIFAKHLYIETERLILRPVSLNDANDMYEYASNQITTQFMPFYTHKSIPNTEENIANFFMANPLGKYGIELKENHKLIGSCDIRIKENEIGEIGYIVHQDYWGKGITTEAAAALIKLGFEELRMKKIYAVHHEDNLSSGAVMRKLGMSQEGILRDGESLRGELYTIHTYGILKEEYFKQNI